MPKRALRLAFLCIALVLLVLQTAQVHWPATETFDPYPVHLDEYHHWGVSSQIARTGDARIADPFTDPTTMSREATTVYPSMIHERGYQIFLAAVQSTTGLDWTALLLYMPLAVALFFGIAVFVLAERWGAGVEAVLWIAIVPTSLRFLGPGFAVPIALALPLLVVGFHLLFDDHAPDRWIPLAIIVSAAWLTHALAALILSMVAIGMIAPSLGRRKGVIPLGLAVVIPALFAWPYYFTYSGGNVLYENPLPLSLDVIRAPGPIPFMFAAIGGVHLLLKREPRAVKAGAILGAMILGFGLLLVMRAATGLDPFKLYDRSVLATWLAIALLAGAGVAGSRDFVSWLATRILPRFPPSAVVGSILLVQLLIVFPLVLGEPTEEVYRPLTDERYRSYSAAAAALGPEHKRALVDGISAMAWTDITGIPLLYVWGPASGPPPAEIENFFEENATNTAFLVSNGVSVVVTNRYVANPDFELVSPGVYVLNAPITTRLSGRS